MIRIVKIVKECGSLKKGYYYQNGVYDYEILTMRDEDDYGAYRIAERILVWINKHGLIGELESIDPCEITDANYSSNAKVVYGMPVIEEVDGIIEYGWVQKGKTGNTFWFYKDRKYDKIIKYEEILFYVKDDYIIGIMTPHAIV